MTDRAKHSPYYRSIAPDPANSHPLHFYPTPPGATKALLSVESFRGVVWEPACGAGDMAVVLASECDAILASDIGHYGYGLQGHDFLTDYTTVADHVVTNPPFKLAQAFAEHALRRVPGKVALFQRLQWLETYKRTGWLMQQALARVYIFRDRVPIWRGEVAKDKSGGKMMAYAWYVFDPLHDGPPTLHWIEYGVHA